MPTLRDRIDDTLRSYSDGNVGISDDLTSMEDSGGVANVLGEGNQQFAEGVDATIDNDAFSLQDAYRDTFVKAPMEAVASARAGERVQLSDEQIGEAWADADDQLTQGIDDTLEGTRFEDSAVIGATRKIADLTIGEAGRNVIGTTTGIDTEDEDTDFETDAWAALDTAATTGGISAVARGARAARGRGLADDIGGYLGRLTARSGDDAATGSRYAGEPAPDGTPALPGRIADDVDVAEDPAGFVSRLLGRSSDDASSAATRGSDDPLSLLGRSSDDVDSTPGVLSRVLGRSSDNVDDAASAATRATDEAADSGSRWSRYVARSSDEADDAASAAARASDDVDDSSGFVSRVLGRSSDDVDDGGRSIRNALFGTRRRQAATGSVGLFGGALALEQSGLFDGMLENGLPGGEMEVQTEDGRSLLLHEDSVLEPNERHPTGGILVEVEEFEPKSDWSQTIGYSVILDVAGRTVTILDQNGDPMQAKISASEVSAAMGRSEAGYYE